jgi:DNA-directed RNA polymerase subunit RPC12/RpoP
MADSVPLSLFHTGRAQCPDCGAPLSLQDGRPRVRCQYCGASAVVERRLRMIEPRPVLGFETLDAPALAARGVRGTHVINAVSQDESHCPTCGAEMAGDALQAIRRCVQCGTESKIERRLVRADDSAAEALAEIEREAEDYEQRQFAQTEALIDRIAKGAVLEDQIAAARELATMPMYVNARTARLLPRLFEVLRRCDPRLEIPLAEIVGKLLCDGDSRLAIASIRAAVQFTFDVNGSCCLLFQLGLGSGIGLKLLLDTADYAATRGATIYASTALWAASTLLDRNFPDRVRLAEIVLYRLLYLRGPVQAWALELCKGQLGLGVRFPTPTVLRFIDDCAAERPELLPHVQKFFYTGPAKTEAEYLARVAFIDELLTPEAKCAALEQLIAPDEPWDQVIGGVLERLLVYAKDPQLAASAEKAIADIVQDGMRPRECVHAMVRRHGESLPEEVRRAYLRAVPDSPLLKPVPVQYWQPTREQEKVGFEKQLADWHQMWDQGIRDAVREMDEKRARARGS